MSLEAFHPAVRDWFNRQFAQPTDCQLSAWPAIRAGNHTLIAAPTGSGKTLAAMLCAIDTLVHQGRRQPLPDQTRVLYVSPLKALSNDVRINLELPIAGINHLLAERLEGQAAIRALVRTGDTPPSAREQMRRCPPHILVSTPESLYILLGSESGRRLLANLRTVIVDEIHAVAPNKRGAHLALSLERLDALCGEPLQRIGLSATQRPLTEIACFLTGSGEGGPPACTLVDVGHRRRWELGLDLPGHALEAVMSSEAWEQVFARLVELIRKHRSTVVFVNTRRLAERVAHALSERLGAEPIASHHGSLSRARRLDAERRLKSGELSALVATSSLELGIDIGDVDLVCQLGTPRSIAALVQRVGRSGHALGRTARGRLFPLTRDDLVECAALLDAVERGALERLRVPPGPLDVLTQQIVAAVAMGEWHDADLFALVRRAWPYRGLDRHRFDEVLRMLAEGYSTRRGRRGAYLHRDAVGRRLRARPNARLAALTCGGAIPDNADYDVVQEPEGTFIGTVNEDFAIESLKGDIFQLGNTSWRILRVETGRVRVEDAHGLAPNMPFWIGEGNGRSDELSRAVSRLRARIGSMLEHGPGERGRIDARRWLAQRPGVGAEAAGQIVEYLAAAHAVFQALPDRRTLAVERFFDESGGMQLVIHSCFGSRINRAFGLALRKRFCRQFNFELQAAASDDAIVLSLGETHSFVLSQVTNYLHPNSVRQVLVQALLDSPMFTIRWRWNANISLAVPRFRAGAKVAPHIQRMQAEDLISVVFPDQIACAENLEGERRIPEHPLVRQTIDDCLHEAMDIDGLERLLGALQSGRVRLVARDLREPSPLALEILSARPYAFLDNAPLEERRTRAVQTRRALDPRSAAELGSLAPEALDSVRAQSWPRISNPDELHDALCVLGVLTPNEGRAHAREFAELVLAGRATVLHAPAGSSRWVATERVPLWRAASPGSTFDPQVQVPEEYAAEVWQREQAVCELVRARLGASGPTDAHTVAATLALPVEAIEAALAHLEAQGYALRGAFTRPSGDEWCERRLLARIHRQTVQRLRRAIEPVPVGTYRRFLCEWQHASPDHRLDDASGLDTVLAQFEGFEAPAGSWESALLRTRLGDYQPRWLDDFCLRGRYTWLRLSPAAPPATSPSLGRATPISLVRRCSLPAWLALAGPPGTVEPLGADSRKLLEHLLRTGAAYLEDLLAGSALRSAAAVPALAELVAHGMIHADDFAALRGLLARAGGSDPQRALADAGRWAALARPAEASGPDETHCEVLARALLRRYGVLCYAVLARESLRPAWHELLPVLRRLEARGELRGGRFVEELPGEQYALPEALEHLRRVNARSPDGALLVLSAADPLNLSGILTPRPRIAARASTRLVLLDGTPIATASAAGVAWLAQTDAQTREAVHARLEAAPGDGAGETGSACARAVSA